MQFIQEQRNRFSLSIEVEMRKGKYIKAHKNIPAISAPFSHAVVVGNYCHTSGQIAWDKSGKFISGSILKETKTAFKNFFTVLKAAGFTKEDIVFVDIAFSNLQDLETITPFYKSLFNEEKQPARTIYQVAALPEAAKIKVMGIAIKNF